MTRRDLIALLGSTAATWPLGAGAQQSDRMRQIGVLIGVADDAQGQARLAAFRKGMQDLGWAEGRNARFHVRFTGGADERARAYAAELVALAPDAILANTAAVVSALQQQTKTIPIVFPGTTLASARNGLKYSRISYRAPGWASCATRRFLEAAGR